MKSPLLGEAIEVLVEIPAWSRVKTKADGSVDFVSPLPCPWAYGCIPGELGGDGDPLDALLLTPAAPKGQRVRSRVQGVVFFLDADQRDDKLICAPKLPSRLTRVAVHAFFLGYALAKRALYRFRGRRGVTRVRSVVWRIGVESAI